MPSPVIRVENLSKKYTLHHLRPKAEGLRHVLEDKVSGPWRAIKKWAGRKPESDAPVESDEDFWALKDVSFEVKRGEVLGIIGRNGSGKSTLLKILSRITEPTTGRIEIEGRVASLLEVGTGFHPELTGRENIFLNGAILGMSRAEVRSRFDEIVAFAEIEKFLDTPVKRYSSGMYVRLAFAVAAHIDPEILIVDEVLAVGDAEFQRKCLGKMHEVASGKGRTVLFVSHNMGAVRNLCRTGLVLKNGCVMAAGSVDEAISSYSALTDSDSTSDLRPDPNKSACLLSVRLTDESGNSLNVWDSARPARLRIRFQINKAMPRIEASLRFETMDGNLAGTAFLSRGLGHPIPTSQGEHEIEVKLNPVSFVPGRYQLTAWLHDPMIELFDFQQRVLAFDIANSAVDFTSLGGSSLLGPMLLHLPSEIVQDSNSGPAAAMQAGAA